MAVERQANLLGQQRVDVPHLRAVESAVCGDFDLLAGVMFAGKTPQVISGLYLITAGITTATNLQLQVANSSIIHYLASESGSIFSVPANRPNETLNSTNPRVTGSFTQSQVNYVGLDFIRSADTSTVDLVEFIDANSEVETPVSVPLARTLDYRIVISTLDFDNNPSIAPIAKVTVDSTGTITAIQDARPQMFRLGTGGTAPDVNHAFPWSAGRKEGALGTFVGGDKAIQNFKGWMDAVMSRLWEVGGGEKWFSSTQDHNVVMARTGSPFVSNGMFFEWTGTNLHWKGLSILFTNSTGSSNQITDQTTDSPGLTDLADGQCIYVDLDRTQNLSGGSSLIAQKSTFAALGDPAVPGSRWVLAWRSGSNIYVRDQSYAVGSSFILATTSAAGMVELSATDGAAASPTKVATVDSASGLAYAIGITRGSNFFGGAGDLLIGGINAADQKVLITTLRGQDETIVQGNRHYFTDPYGAPLTAQNVDPFTGSMSADPNNLAARFGGYNFGTSRLEYGLTIAANGVLGFRSTSVVVNTPAPTGANPIDVKLFFTNNGLTTPNFRQQMCIMWQDGSLSIIAESDPT